MECKKCISANDKWLTDWLTVGLSSSCIFILCLFDWIEFIRGRTWQWHHVGNQHRVRLTNNRSLIAVNLLICLRTREVGTYERCRVSMYVLMRLDLHGRIHKIICEMSGNERSAASLKVQSVFFRIWFLCWCLPSNETDIFSCEEARATPRHVTCCQRSKSTATMAQ